VTKDRDRMRAMLWPTDAARAAFGRIYAAVFEHSPRTRGGTGGGERGGGGDGAAPSDAGGLAAGSSATAADAAAGCAPAAVTVRARALCGALVAFSEATHAAATIDHARPLTGTVAAGGAGAAPAERGGGNSAGSALGVGGAGTTARVVSQFTIAPVPPVDASSGAALPAMYDGDALLSDLVAELALRLCAVEAMAAEDGAAQRARQHGALASARSACDAALAARARDAAEATDAAVAAAAAAAAAGAAAAAAAARDADTAQWNAERALLQVRARSCRHVVEAHARCPVNVRQPSV
jgi:hypothetical protein